MAEMMQVVPANDALELLLDIARDDDAQGRRHDIYAAMFAFAAACLKRDMTQTAADTLAFLLQDPEVSLTVRAQAAEIFDELESRICPRVILDARGFADGMDLPTMLEYLLDLIALETT